METYVIDREWIFNGSLLIEIFSHTLVQNGCKKIWRILYDKFSNSIHVRAIRIISTIECLRVDNFKRWRKNNNSKTLSLTKRTHLSSTMICFWTPSSRCSIDHLEFCSSHSCLPLRNTFVQDFEPLDSRRTTSKSATSYQLQLQTACLRPCIRHPSIFFQQNCAFAVFDICWE